MPLQKDPPRQPHIPPPPPNSRAKLIIERPKPKAAQENPEPTPNHHPHLAQNLQVSSILFLASAIIALPIKPWIRQHPPFRTQTWSDIKLHDPNSPEQQHRVWEANTPPKAECNQCIKKYQQAQQSPKATSSYTSKPIQVRKLKRIFFLLNHKNNFAYKSH